MGKKALLIGCNYPGTKAELKGCINDVKRMHRCLIDSFGFDDSDIAVMIDTDRSCTQPTGANVRRAIKNLIQSAEPGDYLFIHYSGHGTRLPAETGEDDDTGYDECIVPCDMNLITDDDFRDFVDEVPRGCRITIVSDSCHSGGLIDKSKEQIGESTKHEDDDEGSSGSKFGFKSFLKRQVENAFESRGIHLPLEGHHQRNHRPEAEDENDSETDHMKNRSLPLSTVIEILKQKTGKEDIDVGNIRPTLFDMFGDDASPKIKKFMKVILNKLQHGGNGEGSGGGFMSMVGSLAQEFLQQKLEANDEALASRNAAAAAAMSGVPSSGVQQPGGGISSGRFGSNNLPVAMSQISHGGSHGHSGVTNRGGISVVGNPAFSSSMNGVVGSLPGISSNSVAAGNRNSVPGLGASPILGNVGPRITNSMGNIVGGGNIGRSISSGGLSVPGLASRVNLATNSGSGSLNLQGPNRLMSGMLQQAPQMLGMLGNSYPTSGGPLSHNQVQAGNSALSSMGMLNDVNSNDNSPFDLNDFPQLTGRPNSAGGLQGQLGSLRKQGVSSIVQQSQEFSIQNEDFPALPGFKGGGSDFPMDLHQTEQLHDNVSMMQSQHFPMARSAGFSLGGTYPSARQQQHTSVSSAGASFTPGSNQDLLHLHGPDLFPSSHGTYHSQMQNSGHPSIGLRPLNSPNPASGMGAYEQLMQQYQNPQNQSQFRLQQMSAVSQSYRDQSLKSLQASSQGAPDRFGLLGLLSVIRMNDPDLTSLALGIDLTTLGLNLNSTDNLYKTFASPWSDEPAKGEPEYNIPSCYYAKQPPPLQQGHFLRFQLSTLFYIFYSMPRDEAQLYAAIELYNRHWFYHKESQLWLSRISNMEPLVKTQQYERGAYLCFDPNTWETVRKENFVLHYDSVEKKPVLPQH